MPDREELQRELDRRGEEILRLRDLLVAKDAELGEALGRLRELEDLSRGLISIAARIQNRILAAVRLVRAPLRRLQGRSGRDGA
jgi:SMC interacting uncharacterized protein involved in chromosome segregation